MKEIQEEDLAKYNLALSILFLPNILWQAIVFKILWGWFVVDIFSCPGLSIAQSIGIILLSSFFKSYRASPKSYWIEIWIAFMSPALTLLIGFLVRIFL